MAYAGLSLDTWVLGAMQGLLWRAVGHHATGIITKDLQMERLPTSIIYLPSQVYGGCSLNLWEHI